MAGQKQSRSVAWAAGILAVASASLLYGQRGRSASQGLGIPGTEATAAVKLEPFIDLPETKLRGTGGVPEIRLQHDRPLTVAILGSLAPVDGASQRFMEATAESLNLLRPDVVLTTGNLVAGMTRDGKTYADEAMRLNEALGGLQMPWLSCPGETDITSGTRDPADRRFEGLYQKYIGPLYYSVNAGDLHAVVLDSEEAGGISDAQYRWLKTDLNKAFEGESSGRVRWVIVTMNRPLWREEGRDGENGWKRVQSLLADFNRRPVVTVEGMNGAMNQAGGPRVIAVMAGAGRAYSQDPAVDGIDYYELGPTAGAPHAGESTRETLRQIFLFRLIPGENGTQGGDVHPSLLQLGDRTPLAGLDSTVVPTSTVTQRERDVMDQIASWGEDVVGVEGSMDLPAPAPPQTAPAATKPEAAPTAASRKMTLHIHNPLTEAIDIQLRLASTQLLATAAEREITHYSAEGLDLPWELDASHLIRHLAPGAKDTITFTINRPESDAPIVNAAPPELQVVTQWNDAEGRAHNVVLRRRVTTVPSVKLPANHAAVRLDGDQGWEQAVRGAAYAWDFGPEAAGRPDHLNPLWEMTADAENVYVRVRAEDDTPSYWPRMALEPKLGGIASDAVVMAWGVGQSAQRVWVMPFAPEGERLWTNEGLAGKESELLKIRPESGVRTAVEKRDGGYTVTLAVPRRLVLQGAKQALVNISVKDNENGLRTWSRSWANPAAAPADWGHVEFVER